MKSCARTVLRPFALARFAACSSSQYMYSFRAVNASPAVLHPAFLSTPFALLAMTSDSSDFLAIFDLRSERLSSDCRSFYPSGRNQEIFRRNPTALTRHPTTPPVERGLPSCYHRRAMEAVAGSLLGVLFGMRHACEPDHLAAISTLIVEQRSARKGLLLGLAWGL